MSIGFQKGVLSRKCDVIPMVLTMGNVMQFPPQGPGPLGFQKGAFIEIKFIIRNRIHRISNTYARTFLRLGSLARVFFFLPPIVTSFLGESLRLYKIKRECPSVRPFVRRSVRHAFVKKQGKSKYFNK